MRIIKALVDDYREFTNWDGYEESMEGLPLPSARTRPLRYVIALLRACYSPIASVVCRVRGHRVVDDGSYATPDSGRESLRCDRCGWTYDHIYY